jgi:hypothetical protein
MKNNEGRFAALGLEKNLDTGWWSKTEERGGFQLRLRTFDWTAAGRISIQVLGPGRSEVLARWTIGAAVAEGGLIYLSAYEKADLALIAAAIGLLLETVAALEAEP